MVVHLAWAACRRRPFSLSCTVVLVTCATALFGAQVPHVLVLWVAASLLGLVVWHSLEPYLLRRLGCRSPGRLERERLQPVLGSVAFDILVADSPNVWLAHGLR